MPLAAHRQRDLPETAVVDEQVQLIVEGANAGDECAFELSVARRQLGFVIVLRTEAAIAPSAIVAAQDADGPARSIVVCIGDRDFPSRHRVGHLDVAFGQLQLWDGWPRHEIVVASHAEQAQPSTRNNQ